MEVRTCRVTVLDTRGASHTIEVMASSLYEAVALGLRAFQQDDWTQETAQVNSVNVPVQNVSVGHKVPLKTFKEWLDRDGGSPRDVSRRRRVKEILGLRVGA